MARHNICLNIIIIIIIIILFAIFIVTIVESQCLISKHILNVSWCHATLLIFKSHNPPSFPIVKKDKKFKTGLKFVEQS